MLDHVDSFLLHVDTRGTFLKVAELLSETAAQDAEVEKNLSAIRAWTQTQIDILSQQVPRSGLSGDILGSPAEATLLRGTRDGSLFCRSNPPSRGSVWMWQRPTEACPRTGAIFLGDIWLRTKTPSSSWFMFLSTGCLKTRLLTVFHGVKTPRTWPLSPGSDHSGWRFMPGCG
jgi:hypothetical protein